MPEPSPTFVPRVLDAAASCAAFPLGGIGTGNVSIGARGELRDWEIGNLPDKGAWLPFTFFAIRTNTSTGRTLARVLESRHQPPHQGDSGYHMGRLAGLPRLAASRMRGQYPVLTIDFVDADLPVEVSLTAFTPFVPLDEDASSLPGFLLRYTVRNRAAEPVQVDIAGSMANPIAIDRRDVFQFPHYTGTPTLRLRDVDHLVGLQFGTDLDPSHLCFGSAVLATTAEQVSALPVWPVNRWQDGVQLFWDSFRDEGRLRPADALTADVDASPQSLPKIRVGSLAAHAELAPGESHSFDFFLTWHVPNRPRAWNGMVEVPNTHADQTIRNHYALRYANAWEAAGHLARELPELEAATVGFRDELFSSSLPAEVVDAVSATLVTLRSTTCLRLDDGTPGGAFAAWEGSFDHAGSCEGTCTHVWNYAQTVAQLFPRLERSARRNEFRNDTLPDGRMRFRTNAVFGGEPLEFYPAVDGQLGTVVRLYREWLFSGDDEFLLELWPHARRALDYAFVHWDSDGDLVLDGQQHNTYDIEFYGQNSLANSMFFAALAAAARIAEHLGDPETARRYRDAARVGAAQMDELLYNGEYYEQRVPDGAELRYQYGSGCLSDQLFGQTLAHLVGLGHVLPVDHVRSTVRAVYRHNFRDNLEQHESVQRTYALGDEAGLLLCSWPRGGRPRVPFVYCDEVWTGIEYQVATHLVYEGYADEGLRLVRAVRDRHDGVRRNPWNEAECGNHYARSMASWGVLLALTGARWDGPRHHLRLAPHDRLLGADGRGRFLVTTGQAWGRVEMDPRGATLTVLGGALDLQQLTVEHPVLGRLEHSGPIQLGAGDTVRLAAATVADASARRT